MLINILRVIKSGLLGFWRNRWVSQATIAVMVITLFVAVSLLIMNALTGELLASLEKKIDVTVYFKPDTSEKEIQSIKENLLALPEVKSVTYLSRHQALKEFKKRHQDDPLILESLTELDKNPLTASLNIRAVNTSKFASIADFVQRNYESLIDDMNYQESKDVINRISQFTTSAKKGGLFLSLGLMLVVVLVTFNTVRLTIYSLRDRIAIMRLVGAPNWFIRGPFLVEGVLYGVIATIVATLVIWGAASLWGSRFSSYLLGFNILSYFSQNLATIIVIELILGIGLGVLSSWIAVRKYLRI